MSPVFNKHVYFKCPRCQRVFHTPIMMNKFRGGRMRVVYRCPYCQFEGDFRDHSPNAPIVEWKEFDPYFKVKR